MVNITTKNTSALAKNHADIVLSFFGEAVGRKSILMDIETWIKSNISPKSNFRKILVADADKLKSIVKFLDGKSGITFPASVIEIENIYAGFAAVDRNWMIDKKKKPYNAYTLVEATGISVCPYCNRNFISNLNDSKIKIAQLDHFYSQKKYPILSLSFYNLIPCCQTCNYFKRGETGELFNPYSQLDADRKLKVNVSLSGPDYMTRNANYDIVWNTKEDVLLENEKTFHLTELYGKNKYYVNQILRIKYLVNGGNLKSLDKFFLKPLGKSASSYLPLLGIHGYKKQDLLQIPFSKLTRDVWNQFNKKK